MCYVIGRTQEARNDVSTQYHQHMIDQGIPRRELLKVSAASALTFGTSLPATAQTSTMRRASPTSSISSAEPADLILKNAKVITVDPRFTIAQAVAIAGERILAVATDAAMTAHTAPWTRVLDLKGKTIIPGLIDGHAHMDREGLRNVFPSLGPVRSIRDIQDRIAELARSKRPGEWIVTMPIGDPPFYFDVPDILAEKRWPTRQELDAAAPNNPVYIRSIWGFWRGTLPLVSCANTEALKRAGIRQWRADWRVHGTRISAGCRTPLVSGRDAVFTCRSPTRSTGIRALIS